MGMGGVGILWLRNSETKEHWAASWVALPSYLTSLYFSFLI